MRTRGIRFICCQWTNDQCQLVKCADTAWVEEARVPWRSSREAEADGIQQGPWCLLPLRTPHIQQLLSYIVNEMERRATVFISSLTLESSVRADKLHFGKRSSEILTRASSKTSQSITVWYIHKSIAWGWQLHGNLMDILASGLNHHCAFLFPLIS